MAHLFAVPNLLNEQTGSVEIFYRRVEQLPASEFYIFDMKTVTWVAPPGVVGLLLSARRLAEQSGKPVLLVNLADKLHSYLQRMDVLDHPEWLRTADEPREEWLRNPQTLNLLELTLINSVREVEAVAVRARGVYGQLLSRSDLDSLIQVLSELCTNIIDHSGDANGGILIQAYKHPTESKRRIFLSVGDLGCGIRGSLARRHSDIGPSPLDYIQAALQGRSARTTGRGGFGLRVATRIVQRSGGFLWVRSETASVRVNATGGLRAREDLAHVPGTQVTVLLEPSLT